jgi:hypothetical protein
MTLPTPGTAESTMSAWPPPGRRGTDHEQERPVARLEADPHVVAEHVRRRLGGDEVGDQDRVVQAVERQVGASREHSPPRAGDGSDQRTGCDRDARGGPDR